jgi:DNA-binding transcriptional ArsR family regulator
MTQATGGAERTSPDGDVPRDIVFSTLSNRRRRLVVRYLLSGHETVEVRDLARAIAARENDIPEAELSYKQRKRVYTSLHQTHLPKLDEAGFVTYERDRGQIHLEALARELVPFLEPPPRVREWARYYLAVAVTAVLTAGLAAAGVPLVSTVPAPLYTVAFAAVVAGLGVAQRQSERRRTVDASLSTDDS